MNNNITLFQKLNTVKELGDLKEIPDFVYFGLADHIQLRPYQIEAIRYFITYYESNLSKDKQIDNMFHMATGSGKTVIMATLILYLYTKGYRNFTFIVNQNSIIEKTRENFINKTSNKYLFNSEVNLLGQNILIREVDDFLSCNAEEPIINICFSTTDRIHSGMLAPRENSLSIDNFEITPVVFLADEAHHLNRATLSTKPQKEKAEVIENTWENSIRGRAFRANVNNIMLEFTATLHNNDEAIIEKYNDRTIYDYSLKHFRKSGYTKVFDNFATDTDPWTRTLIACVMSEFRRYLFSDVKQNVKPVIMIQSRLKSESAAFYKEFFSRMNNLTVDDLKRLKNIEGVPPLKKALKYFENKDGGLSFLANSLKYSMSEENSLEINDSKENTKENLVKLNSLEDKDNSLRLIFTVKMLIEGWDVLNLFDIVKTFENKPTNEYTLSEAQLIGRGARYFPFQLTEDQERFKRKYDYDLDNIYRYLETMYFHSANDSKYISMLNKALKETGMLDETKQKINYILKESFKETELYKTGLIFSNSRIEKKRSNIFGIEESKKRQIFTYKTVSNSGQIISLFDGGSRVMPQSKQRTVKQLLFKDIDYHVLLGASERYPVLRFNHLKKKYPNLKSKREFLTSDNYLGNNKLEIIYYDDLFTGKDIYNGLISAFEKIGKDITSIRPEYRGAKTFKAKAISTVIKDKSVMLKIEDRDYAFDGVGISQKEVFDERLKLDLSKEDWYVYQDNFGTDEEKRFLAYFKHYIVHKLEEKELEFYVIRNERIADLAIYSFEDGERFEPDFLLIIKDNHDGGYNVSQVYAEPKGEHILEKDRWKNSFLTEIESTANIDDKYTFNNNYKVMGLPLFNEEHTLVQFNKAVDDMLKKL